MESAGDVFRGGLGATHPRDLGGRVAGEGCRVKMKMLWTPSKANSRSPGKGFLPVEDPTWGNSGHPLLRFPFRDLENFPTKAPDCTLYLWAPPG